jgi:hypothetical protein
VQKVLSLSKKHYYLSLFKLCCLHNLDFGECSFGPAKNPAAAAAGCEEVESSNKKKEKKSLSWIIASYFDN